MKAILLTLCVGGLLFSAGCDRAEVQDKAVVPSMPVAQNVPVVPSNVAPSQNISGRPKAVNFTLTQTKGGQASLDGLRNGGKAVIFFWATWCPHCREQLKEMSAQKKALEELGAAVILVDIGEDKAAVDRFMAAKGYDFNVLLDLDSAVAEIYEIVGVPTIVFVGQDGTILDSGNSFPENYVEILK
ncbi:MAG: TlpA family protein disulfide reductase [Candidatus Omnitrophica bacterium]|nr:TlpA family protein disulfide reductase [Candidatus Omnitrophota bacterium]